jgi:hypothetical protein
MLPEISSQRVKALSIFFKIADCEVTGITQEAAYLSCGVVVIYARRCEAASPRSDRLDEAAARRACIALLFKHCKELLYSKTELILQSPFKRP